MCSTYASLTLNILAVSQYTDPVLLSLPYFYLGYQRH